MTDGHPVPGMCDGMGIVRESGSRVTLVRNHELRGSTGAIGDAARSWDVTGGGTTNLVIDTATETLQDSFISLSGTLNNCAGGVTPWGSWLSCEEAPYTPSDTHHGIEMRQVRWRLGGARRKHGYVFEVPPEGNSQPRPFVEMGQFYHEAAIVDPRSGTVYMTEDTAPAAGFYRFIPHKPGELAAGGRLQMMRVTGWPVLSGDVPANRKADVSWVDIDEPDRGHSPGTHNGRGVVEQGLAAGGSAFRSLEGCAVQQDKVYFTSKNGGSGNAGQVFVYDQRESTLELLWSSAGYEDFTGPDNVVISPAGSLIICEDRGGGDLDGQHITGLGADGKLFDVCRINPDITGVHAGYSLHNTARSSEWAGACFSANGEWMFANIYNPGITVAITGPWTEGPV
jgi:secreted PhoX family phosphatase